MGRSKNIFMRTSVALPVIVVGVIAAYVVLALLLSWLVLVIVNWAWPELPDAFSVTWPHVVGVAAVVCLVGVASNGASVTTRE